jgi:hypothetical protein
MVEKERMVRRAVNESPNIERILAEVTDDVQQLFDRGDGYQQLLHREGTGRAYLLYPADR